MPRPYLPDFDLSIAPNCEGSMKMICGECEEIGKTLYS